MTGNSIFLQATEQNQKRALLRAEILEAYNKYTGRQKIGIKKARKKYIELFNSGLIDKELKENWQSMQNELGRKRESRLTKDKIYNWKKRQEKKGLVGLLEEYNNGGIRTDPGIIEAIQKLIWRNHLVTYQDILEYLPLLCEGKPLPSYQTIRNIAKAYREENWDALVLYHEGLTGLRDRNMQVALGKKDEDLKKPNERWEIDTTVADLFTGSKIPDTNLITSDGKRCKIIGITDVFSRSLKFYAVEKETAYMVGQVIRDRIIAWGIPGEIVIDNGKSFKNNRISHFLRGIGIAVHICIPANPVEKPHIERAFRTLSEKLLRRLPGYSGNSVQTRPNDIQIEYTIEGLQDIMDRYIISVYAETVHSSTNQRPRERMSPPGFTPKTINERDLDILLMEEHSRKVHQGYISYKGGRYFHPKLPEKRNVKIRINDFDASEILVFVDNKFLCIAEDLRLKGKSPQEIQGAKKERNKEIRTRIKAHEALLGRHQEFNVIDIIEHHEKLKPIELPKRAEVIEFPEVSDIQYSKPDSNPVGEEVTEIEESENIRQRLIRSKREMYLDVMMRKNKGELLDDFDRDFLEKYLESSEYRMIGQRLVQKLQRGAANER